MKEHRQSRTIFNIMILLTYTLDDSARLQDHTLYDSFAILIPQTQDLTEAFVIQRDIRWKQLQLYCDMSYIF